MMDLDYQKLMYFVEKQVLSLVPGKLFCYQDLVMGINKLTLMRWTVLVMRKAYL